MWGNEEGVWTTSVGAFRVKVEQAPVSAPRTRPSAPAVVPWVATDSTVNHLSFFRGRNLMPFFAIVLVKVAFRLDKSEIRRYVVSWRFYAAWQPPTSVACNIQGEDSPR